MTSFIRQHGPLDVAEMDDIIAAAPIHFVDFQKAGAALPLEERSAMAGWIDQFNGGMTRLAAR